LRLEGGKEKENEREVERGREKKSGGSDVATSQGMSSPADSHEKSLEASKEAQSRSALRRNSPAYN
jgi:hypothetical protein